jgi:2-polyprenyl-6-hydroxyphenyl methylase/3-demethylubiquinone-9 3-methyltransferase
MTFADYGYTSADATGTSADIYQAVERLLRANIEPGARVLDLGCGNGIFTKHLVNNGFCSFGVDTSASGIAVASKAHPGVPFFCGDIESLLRSGQPTFDAVVSVEVIEHCPSTSDFCLSIAHSLRPGGTAIVTTPYHGYVKNLLIALLGMGDRHYNPLWDGGHIKFFSPTTLTRALEQAGMQVCSISRVGRLPMIAKSMVIHAKKPSKQMGSK